MPQSSLLVWACASLLAASSSAQSLHPSSCTGLYDIDVHPHSSSVTIGSGCSSSNCRHHNNGDCDAWYIQCPTDKFARLRFSYFNTETSYDLLYLFTGSDFSSPHDDAIAIESGHSTPSSVTADSPNMIAVYDTDGSVLGGGWTASASCVSSPGPVTGACWEAYTPNYGCSGYSDAGYTCVGDYCAAMNPGGTPSHCASQMSRGKLVNPHTGRCSFDISSPPPPSMCNTYRCPSGRDLVANSHNVQGDTADQCCRRPSYSPSPPSGYTPPPPPRSDWSELMHDINVAQGAVLVLVIIVALVILFLPCIVFLIGELCLCPT
eukprot:COSAG02_NODE_1714_length_11220_cov_3.198543_11_plen_320_part_00